MRKIEINFEARQPVRSQIDNMAATFKADILENIYESTCKALYKRHRLTTVRTHAELHMFSRIRKETKLEVFTSVWIGRFCVDLFIPNIGGKIENGKRNMRGLVIEVNGDVHNFEPKMVKDENRVKVLGELGIGVLYVDNPDIDSPEMRNLISKIKDFPRLGWRSKKKVWSRIHAWTIIANNSLSYGGDDDELQK